MSKLWHYGDSYSMNDFQLENLENGYRAETQIGNFGSIISNQLDKEYNFKGVTGFSNELIFSRILDNLNNFKKGDIIFINWSYFTRGSYIKKDGAIHSTNNWFDENMPGITDEGKDTLEKLENYSFIMDYILSYNYDFNIKLFYGYVAPCFKNLIEKGITIYNLFINYNDKLTFGKSYKKFVMPYAMGINVRFDGGYMNWLVQNELHGEEEGHYTADKQEYIALEILRRMKGKTKAI